MKKHDKNNWFKLIDAAIKNFNLLTNDIESTQVLESLPHGQNQCVLVCPGFMTNDTATVLLRRRLDIIGYRSKPWGHGINLGQSRHGDIIEKLELLLKQSYLESAKPVLLIGWSLGGVLMREVARIHPELVTKVITLGSPIAGLPKDSPVWPFFKLTARVLGNLKKIEEWSTQITKPVDKVKCTAIYSLSDAIVPYYMAMEQPSALTKNIAVEATHMSLPFSLAVFKVIAEELAIP